ncbi:MAG: hypothetical protein A3C36_07545 [Omnitrophica WOR_2 bacterium RIFCSPHIGHO2_02_FULL_52_10]|nr:MAG: hypothetical protein A3C36_07545 [Omnitrophica WOR_2 bacterium RIFCSPHIGHO2_02_FULL_52_10]
MKTPDRDEGSPLQAAEYLNIEFLNVGEPISAKLCSAKASQKSLRSLGEGGLILLRSNTFVFELRRN